MTRAELAADFEILGLGPEASIEEVERAFREQRSLWAERALATYGLAEGEEGDAHLDRIDEAHRRLLAALSVDEGLRPPPIPRPEPPRPPEPEPEGSLPRLARLPREDLPAFDPEAPGAWLKASREHLGLTVSEVAARTRISRMYLEQIEQERFTLLPARVYTRGFVLQYARELGSPTPDAVATAFLDRMGAEG